LGTLVCRSIVVVQRLYLYSDMWTPDDEVHSESSALPKPAKLRNLITEVTRFHQSPSINDGAVYPVFRLASTEHEPPLRDFWGGSPCNRACGLRWFTLE
jgi:hypothetical protein